MGVSFAGGQTGSYSRRGRRICVGAIIHPMVTTDDGFTWLQTDEREGFMAYNGHEAWLRPHMIRCLHRDALYVEAGTHVGTHAIRMCRHAQRVVGFEPHTDNRRILLHNVAINGATNMEVRMAALASKPGYLWFHDGPHPGADFVSREKEFEGRDDYPAGTSTTQVLATTLDQEFPSPVVIDLLKIDVEGFEAEVLAGGRMLLAEKRLRAIVVEFHDPKGSEKVNAIVESLREMGYKAESISPSEHPQDYYLFRL